MSKNNTPKDKGNITFQPNHINWSYLYLGKVARTQINANKIKTTLQKNQI